MARQPDIRYVQFYTQGTAAKKLEFPLRRTGKKAVLPKPKPRREVRRVIYVDPLALCAIVAAGILLLSMVAGMIHLGMADRENRELEAYVSQLHEEHTRLEQEFFQEYDPQQVHQRAEALGMISFSEAEHIQLELTPPEQTAEPGVWEQIKTFFQELFA